MAFQLQQMADASTDLEISKIEVQLNFFVEKMNYAHKKDHWLYKNFLIANENAHLAIVKRCKVVSCLV